MKKTLYTIALVLLMSSRLAAVSAPAGLTVTPWADGGTTLSWLTDTAATQWYIYVGGIQYFSPTRTDVGRPSASTYSYNVTGISQQSLPAYITMKAVGGGQLSAFSASVTVTAVGPVPFTYVMNQPGVPLLVSGTVGGSSSSGEVTVTAFPMAVPSAGMVAYTALSSVALTITITAASFIELACGPGAAAGYKMQITNSVVAPWNITTGAQVGNYVASTTTTQVWAKKPGWLHIAGQGATAAPWVQIDPVQ